MKAATSFLEYLGSVSLEFLWLPAGIWTIVALIAYFCLRVWENRVQVAYQYHTRVALIWALAAGVVSSALFNFMPSSSTQTSADTIRFFVVQNPITVTTATPANSISWTEPAVWIGIITAFAIIAAVGALVKLAINFISLSSFSDQFAPQTLHYGSKLSTSNRHLLSKYTNTVTITFSDVVEVPCTFGWFRKHIVLPEHFLNDAEKMNMALRHELTHIQNSDYLLNTTVQMIKALFIFHPLVHKLARDIEEYREMYCDQYVLQDADISQKSYAQLLFELSPKSVFKTSAAVNMAVRFSTLKKRIQTMKTPTPNLPSLKWSISLMLALSLVVTGLMSCSDIEEGGITQAEVEDTQAKMSQTPDEQEPLFFLNGEEVERNGDIMTRLKPKYIESIDVLKGEKALDTYGERGKNGVVMITLIDKEKALADMRTDEEMQAMKIRSQKGVRADDNKEIFVAVENAPQLEGGLRSIQKHVQYPQSCRQAGIEGRVTLQFLVTKEGNVENVEVLRGIGGGCDEAAMNAVKNYAKFKPGKQRGKPVNVRYSLPIFFKLSDNGDSKETSSRSQGEIQSEQMGMRDFTVSNDQITGIVYAKNSNEPLHGANVTIASTSNGTVTDQDGKFSLSRANDDQGKVRISYVGYSSLIAEYK